MKLMLGLCVLLVMAGCATIDTSQMETAETLRSGSFKAGLYNSTGVIMNNAMSINERQKQISSKTGIIGNPPKQKGTTGARVSIGLTKNTEIIGSLCMGSTGKIALKYGFPAAVQNKSVAIIPTYCSYYGSFEDNHLSGWKNGKYIEEYSSYGYEFPVLFTTKTSPSTSHTISFRAAYYPVKYKSGYHNTFDDEITYTHEGQKDIMIIGIGANIHMSSTILHLTTFAGVDYVHVDGGKKGFVPNIGIGYGFQINPQCLFK